MDEQELDVTKLKYVLYARKSTEDESRQIRSTSDQIAECEALASRLGLRVIKPHIIEDKSAKRPNNRPKFKQMLKDIRARKYDGILAWNPDRLARNMLEGGEIIDMIDEGIIKDLKFVTHHFTSDANGKMLLGMAFVLSKQYSDKLSQDVTRGVRRRLQEGKTAAPKHGYVNEGGIYHPDNESGSRNFELICDAWQMRLKGDSLETISSYMNSNGYGRLVKSSGHKVDMDIRILSDIFANPFYYGILVQAEQKVDLRLLYDFVPAVTEEEFFQVQQLSYRRIKPSKPHKINFYPFRLMVNCYFCGRNMVVGPSTSQSGKKYLSFRCDNKETCPRNSLENKKKDRRDPTKLKASIRAKVVLEFIYSFLKDGLNFKENDYKKYIQELSEISDEKRIKLTSDVHSKEGLLRRVNSEIKEIALGLIKLKKGSTELRINQERITELEGEKYQLEHEISTIRAMITSPEKDRLSLKQFLNLSKEAFAIVQSGDPVIKDEITRIIFLNFTVDNEKVASYQLKPPFDELLKSRQILTSRGPGN